MLRAGGTGGYHKGGVDSSGKRVVELGGVQELREVIRVGEEGLWVGAGVSLSRLANELRSYIAVMNGQAGLVTLLLALDCVATKQVLSTQLCRTQILKFLLSNRSGMWPPLEVMSAGPIRHLTCCPVSCSWGPESR